jgi:uncharacterized protein (DUF2062 family)
MPHIWSKNHPLNKKTIKTLSKIKGVNRPGLWRLEKKAVAKGVAIGVFFGCMTIVPFQMILAGLLAIRLRANLPIAIAMTWICNPFTIIPLTYLNYSVGNGLLGAQDSAITFHGSSWKFYSYNDFWAPFMANIVEFGKAFFVGSIIVTSILTTLSYFIVIFLWRLRRT